MPPTSYVNSKFQGKSPTGCYFVLRPLGPTTMLLSSVSVSQTVHRKVIPMAPRRTQLWFLCVLEITKFNAKNLTLIIFCIGYRLALMKKNTE